jgi:putative ABC transport system permease protein
VLFDRYTVSTLNFQSMSQVGFAFAVTPMLIAEGMTYAVGMRLVGAVWPAWRARLPIVTGLRDVCRMATMTERTSAVRLLTS